MRRLALTALCALLLTGCSGSENTSDATPGAGEDWVATPKTEVLPDFPHSSYTFEYSYSSQTIQYSAVSTVEDGEVVTVEFLDPHIFAEATEFPDHYKTWADEATIDFIIEDIRAARESGEAEVVWRENRDYPEWARLDPVVGSVDDESSWSILSVEVVETPAST